MGYGGVDVLVHLCQTKVPRMSSQWTVGRGALSS